MAVTGKWFSFERGSFPFDNSPIPNPETAKIGHVDSHDIFKNIDYMMMDGAFRASLDSKAKRKWGGAVIAKNGRPISNGYNGTSPGTCNKCEKDNVTLPRVIHAEQNALNFCSRFGLAVEGCTLYSTCCPCEMCAASIGVNGIKRVVFFEEYRLDGGKRELLRNNIEVIQMLPHERLFMLPIWLKEIERNGIGS